ncbi:hypothetical protein [Micromonospora coerulea]|uniref:hypothetical protein n=1 Tax=Micromonospora coerulea TaxID=47856 RepID=UPI0027DE6327|nr:hypothetical protein [Micromonospora veneta]
MPISAIAAADRAFALLVRGPDPLQLDGRDVPGLPRRRLSLDTVRDLLVGGVDTGVSDAVWRILSAHARADGPAWVVGAVGVAVPGLTRIASRLAHGFAKQADDIGSEVVTGFLQALRGDDLSGPRVWLRLCWAAWRAGHGARRTETTLELPHDLPVGSRTPRFPYGHPDLVLARAVTAGVITAEQAELIGATRLGGTLVDHLAAELEVSAPTIRMRRRRAEQTLAAAIHRGDLAVRANRARPH